MVSLTLLWQFFFTAVVEFRKVADDNIEYSICWAEEPDKELRPDSYISDHLVDFGELLVVGPEQGEYKCEVGLPCSIMIKGKYLDKSQYIK